jgi:hypothetical protein
MSSNLLTEESNKYSQQSQYMPYRILFNAYGREVNQYLQCQKECKASTSKHWFLKKEDRLFLGPLNINMKKIVRSSEW